MYNKLNNNNFMNKLINRISPETSENRILHAGFSIILMSEEIAQTLSGLSSDMIIFILSGSITIYSTKEEKKTIGEQYINPEKRNVMVVKNEMRFFYQKRNVLQI